MDLSQAIPLSLSIAMISYLLITASVRSIATLVYRRLTEAVADDDKIRASSLIADEEVQKDRVLAAVEVAQKYGPAKAAAILSERTKATEILKKITAVLEEAKAAEILGKASLRGKEKARKRG